MKETALIILMNTGSVMMVLLLLRYAFGAKLNLNLKSMAIVALIHYIYGFVIALFGSDSLAFVGTIVFMVAIFLIRCKEKRWKIFVYLIPVLLLYVQFGNYMSLFDNLFGLEKRPFYRYSDVVLIALLILWGAYVDKKHIKYSLNFFECVFVGFFAYISNFYGDVVAMIAQSDKPGDRIFFLQSVWVIFVTILNSCVIFAVVYRKRHAHQKMIAEMYRRYFEEEYQAFCQKSDRQRELDRMRHDWKNHVNTIQTMWEKGESEQAMRYVASLAEESSSNIYTILSGNEVADAILNLKYEKAKEKGIEFRFKGNLSSLSCIEPVDICVLLGNALDNALEACGKSEEDSKIHLTATESKGFLLLTMENSLHAPIVLREGRPVTSKKHASEHGFGVMGMEHVAQKYNGDLRFEIAEKIFKVQVMLPLEREH